jgi:hypothetical protein
LRCIGCISLYGGDSFSFLTVIPVRDRIQLNTDLSKQSLKVKTDIDVYIYPCLHNYVIRSHRRENALLLIDRKGNQVDAY